MMAHTLYTGLVYWEKKNTSCGDSVTEETDEALCGRAESAGAALPAAARPHEAWGHCAHEVRDDGVV